MRTVGCSLILFIAFLVVGCGKAPQLVEPAPTTSSDDAQALLIEKADEHGITLDSETIDKILGDLSEDEIRNGYFGSGNNLWACFCPPMPSPTEEGPCPCWRR